MKIVKIAILFILIMFLCSCYNYVEVNEIAIVEGIAIDFESEKYDVIVEIIDEKSENENSYLIEASSNDLDEAFNNINDLSSKDISMSHLETVILSKEILINHIETVANYFINNNNITTNFYLVYANNPKEIFYNNNDNYPINSKTITDNLDKNKNNKYQFDYIYTLIRNNKYFEIPYITLDNNNIKIEKEYFIYEK